MLGYAAMADLSLSPIPLDNRYLSGHLGEPAITIWKVLLRSYLKYKQIILLKCFFFQN